MNKINQTKRDAILAQGRALLTKNGIYGPRDIAAYLNNKVAGQDEAKKAAAMLVWNHMHGLSSNELFVGPSGCGKTHIWRTLRELEPLDQLITITDASSITQKGWKGSTKVDTVLNSKFYNEYNGRESLLMLIELAIIVYDEFDKMIYPQHSSAGDNVSFSIQSQMLSLADKNSIQLTENERDSSNSVTIDTCNISLVFCGAFEDIYKKRKSIAQTTAFGFGNSPKENIKPITLEEIIDFGLTPELAGRIGHVTELYPLTAEQIKGILTDPVTSPATKYVKAYDTTVSMTEKYINHAVEYVLEGEIGMRGLFTKIDHDIKDKIFEGTDLVLD